MRINQHLGRLLHRKRNSQGKIAVPKRLCAQKSHHAGETDPGGSGQQADHVVRIYPVLAAVGLVRHNEDIMVRVDWLQVRPVELLDQGEHKAGIAPQLVQQVRAVGGDKLPGLGGAQDAAVLKRIADLLVQLHPVCQNHNSGGAGEFAADFLGRYEKGLRDVPTDVLIRLARYYGTSTDYILGLTNNLSPYR